MNENRAFNPPYPQGQQQDQKYKELIEFSSSSCRVFFVNSAPSILGCSTAVPDHYYSQSELLDALESLWGQRRYSVARLRQFHQNLQIQGRHLALPKEEYLRKSTFGERNQAFITVGLGMAQGCVTEVLLGNGLECHQVAHLLSTTVTGLAVPSLDARLMNRLPFASSLKRTPIFGLGCLGGAAGVARTADYLRGAPQQAALLVSVELCSLTLQAQDLSVPNLVSCGLFGDGAAATLMVGAEHPFASRGPRVVDSRSVFFPDSEDVMGWEIGEWGFKVVLSPDVPQFARRHLTPEIVGFLKDHQLEVEHVKAWVAHPGGPKVIEALEDSLGLSPESFRITRESLATVGNLSSASVLFVLKETLAHPPPPGSFGLLLAMGPAFCAELVLLQW